MNKRRIKADWTNAHSTYVYALGILFNLPMVIICIICIISKDIGGISGPLLFIIISMGILIYLNSLFNNWGFTIDYRKERVNYIGYASMPNVAYEVKPKAIKISEIDHVELQEVKLEKGKGLTDFLEFTTRYYLNNVPRDYVYRNGKVFDIVVYKKDGALVKYPYTMMYKARSKKRVMKHEAKMRAILDELNAYIASNDRWHSIMSEI